MSLVPKWSGIDEEYKQDSDSIYTSDGEWEAAYENVAERVLEPASYEGRVTEGPKTPLELFEITESMLREVSMVIPRTNLHSSQNTRNQEYQAQVGRTEALVSKVRSAVGYPDPELQELDRDGVVKFVEEEPELNVCGHYFGGVLRVKGRTRSAGIEETLADLSEATDVSNDIYSMLTNVDLEFPTVEKSDGTSVETTRGNFAKLRKHPDREFRRTIREEFYDRQANVRNVVDTSLKNSVKEDVKTAHIRDYETVREAVLDGPNVPVKVYDNLLDTVRNNLGCLHHHAELKCEAVGADELRMWDPYVSLTSDHGPEIPYEQVKECIVEAVEPLSEAYQERMAKGLDDCWVDVYGNRGKRFGAYSAGARDIQPFIMMNYQDSSVSMFMLTHELGHLMRSRLASNAQPWYDASYEIFTTEVASTVNETLLTEYLLEDVDDDELRVHVLDEYLERFRPALLRQTMFTDFELQIHEMIGSDGAFMSNRFDELYDDLKETYYEPAAADGRIAREQEQIPHFYYDYYVYQYVTGISTAAAIAEHIREEGESAAADYHEALTFGGSECPLDVFQTAGVDMAEPEPIEGTVSVYAELLSKAAILLGLE